MTVLTVGSCLRQTMNWSVMFVFTLVQSCTHVDTVQNVLHEVSNWNDICWSHTMKALGSHVTFVRRNLATVNILRYTYVDMKVWSRMFVVNVQNVSVHQVNWKTISWYTQTSDALPVVLVLQVLSIKLMFWDTLRDVLMLVTLILATFNVHLTVYRPCTQLYYCVLHAVVGPLVVCVLLSCNEMKQLYLYWPSPDHVIWVVTSFSRSGHLKVHIRRHEGVKPYVCCECPKRFCTSTDLKRHQLVHLDVKGFACGFCAKSFKRKDSFFETR